MRIAEYAVKVRFSDTKRFRFLSSGGYTNRLRVHALRYTKEQAEAIAADIIKEYGDQLAVKVVKL